VLGKNAMNIAALPVKCRPGLRIEIAQQLEITRPHVDARE